MASAMAYVTDHCFYEERQKLKKISMTLYACVVCRKINMSAYLPSIGNIRN